LTKHTKARKPTPSPYIREDNTAAEIAELFKVARSTVYRIVRRTP
jgi:predicted DNA-binding protein YlxM (UPF0122 family)